MVVLYLVESTKLQTSRNESYVRISIAAENGLIVIQTKNITLPLFFHKRHLWHVGRQLAVVLLYILHQKSVLKPFGKS